MQHSFAVQNDYVEFTYLGSRRPCDGKPTAARHIAHEVISPVACFMSGSRQGLTHCCHEQVQEMATE